MALAAGGASAGAAGLTPEGGIEIFAGGIAGMAGGVTCIMDEG